jgi:hypothetical protein
MIKAVNIILVVLCGVVGGWLGYWAGHALGWSVDATWPTSIGGGTGAILMSMGMAVLFVAVAVLLVMLVPSRWVKRVLRSGLTASATVVSAAETGAVGRTHGIRTHQVTCVLDVHGPGGRPYRARTTQFVSEVVEGALKPGAEVAVRYDPERPEHVAIDQPLARAA